MAYEDLSKIIGNIPVYEDEKHSLREYQDAKVLTMALINNYKKLSEMWEKVTEEIEWRGGNDEKSRYKNLNPSYVLGLKEALNIINKHMEELNNAQNNNRFKP